MGLLRFNISVPAFGAGTTWSEDDNSTIPDTTCDVPLDSYTPGMIGKGIGYTNPSPTARLTMRYYGSSIWFWGRTIDISDMKIAAGGVLNWTMELNDDYPVAGPGLPTPAVDPLLVYWQQDAVGLRFADIGPGSDFPKGGSWQLDGVTVTTEIQTEAPTLEDVNITVLPFVENGNLTTSPLLNSTSGTWKVQTEVGGTGGQAVEPYPQLVSFYDGFSRPPSILINIPINTSMVMVNGTMGPTGANATFTITPRPAGLTAVRLLTYNPWTWTNQNLFWWPLDPTTEYTLRVTNDIDELGLSSVSFYSNQWTAPIDTNSTGDATGTSSDPAATPLTLSKNSSNTAAIAGAVAGGIAALLIIIGAVWWRWYRRRRPIDEDKHAMIAANPRNQRSSSILVTAFPRGPPTPERSPSPMLTVPSKPQAFEPFLDSPSDATSSSSYIVEPSVSPTSPLTNTGVVYEQDAGYIEMVEPQRVPPGYNPQWAVDRECRLEFLSPTTPTFPPTPTSPSPFSPSRTASEIELGLKQRTVGE